ncbi:MAG: lytic transglycosylase [Deltaproteobacteria bacterium CG11_big_fil_rev_8_21_14_0_20_49_13]|nr:MAG: lytic transglycosylase [Deltaproteobacteria bacterium CG11_big_fil_rev_8_21_14_0_20_49_13]
MLNIKIGRYLIVIGVMVLAIGCASQQGKKARWMARQLPGSSSQNFDIPVTVNDRVIAWIDYFQGPGHRHYARYLARSGRYVPHMQAILKKYGLPQDLVYLALIESGFSATAYSRAKAAGHWQFIHGTGKHYGLAIGNGVDERRDPEDSTVAAAKFLRDLHQQFGDWYLAMAAYNAGPGKIEKAIRLNGTRNFWTMIAKDRHYLRAETKDYVPKFIAAAIIAKSPEKFGFGDVVYDKPMEMEEAYVESQTDLEVIAKCADVSVDMIQDLNPSLTSGTTPSGARNYTVNLPMGTARKFSDAYAKVPDSERLMALRHTVRRGESLGKIAKRYGVSVREILAVNGLSSPSRIRKGSTLIIPTGGAAKKSARYIASKYTARPDGRLIKHKVKRGESISVIANNYGVDRADLRKWNGLKSNNIRRGQVLKIYSEDEGVKVASSVSKRPAPATGGKNYVVRRGDSWWKIAQRNGISINDLKGWNPTLADKDLKAGARLKIYQNGEAPQETPTSTTASSVEVEEVSSSDRLESMPARSLASLPTSDHSELLSMKAEISTSAVQNLELPSNSKEISYKIKSGDTLWDIARKYGVSVKNIADANDLNPKSRLKPGTKITIRSK